MMYRIEAVDVMNQKFACLGHDVDVCKKKCELGMKHILHPLLSKPNRLKLLTEISRPL